MHPTTLFQQYLLRPSVPRHPAHHDPTQQSASVIPPHAEIHAPPQQAQSIRNRIRHMEQAGLALYGTGRTAGWTQRVRWLSAVVRP